MHQVLLIEGDPLVRSVMREHLESEGYSVVGVSSVTGALDLLATRSVSLVLLEFSCGIAATSEQLRRLRSRGAAVVMLSAAPRSVADLGDGAATVVWSPFDPHTLGLAVRRIVGERRVAGAAGGHQAHGEGTQSAAGGDEHAFVPSSSGTFEATRPTTVAERALASTLPAPPEGAAERPTRDPLEVLAEAVMKATGGRRS